MSTTPSTPANSVAPRVPFGEKPTIAVIGLGIMGGAISGHLLAAGYEVLGLDPDSECLTRFAAEGGAGARDLAHVAARADIVITSLPSARALDDTVDGLIRAPSRRPASIVIEVSTLALEDKQRASAALATKQIDMLDAPLSGTGAQAAVRDLSVYASGTRESYERVEPVLHAFAMRPLHVGAFGNGTRLKLAANLLVAIHNVAAAEALNFAERCGIDGALAIEVLSKGAGASRMFELRAPLMAQRAYVPATMKLDVWQKDMALIAAQARAVSAMTPLLDATVPLYAAATAADGLRDTAAVFEAFRASAHRLAGDDDVVEHQVQAPDPA